MKLLYSDEDELAAVFFNQGEVASVVFAERDDVSPWCPVEIELRRRQGKPRRDVC